MDEIMQDIETIEINMAKLCLRLFETSDEDEIWDIEDDLENLESKLGDLEEELRDLKENCEELDYRDREFERMV